MYIHFKYKMNTLGLQEACSLVIGFVEVMCNLFSLAVAFSTTVGYFIVQNVVVVMKGFLYFLETVWLIVKILYEDGLTFLYDLGHKFATVSSAIFSVYQCCLCAIHNCWSFAKNTCIIVYDFVTYAYMSFYTHFSKAIAIVTGIPEFLKQTIILVGNGVWLALQLIPLAVVYVSSMTIYLIGRSCEEISSITQDAYREILRMIHKIITFASDIPPESLIGLMVGSCIIYFCIQHRYSLASRSVLVYEFVCGYIGFISHFVWVSLENMILRLVVNQNIDPQNNNEQPQPVNSIDLPDTDDSTVSEASSPDTNPFIPHESRKLTSTRRLRLKLLEEQENKLCIVCQDRVKCVILFPCRHVCLCAECCAVIKGNRGTCPVCRQLVRRSMKVYL